MAKGLMDKYVNQVKKKTVPMQHKSNSWIGNALRSVGYSSFDIIKELAPSSIDTAITAVNTGQELATKLNKIRTSDKPLKTALDKSYYLGLGKRMFKNAMEDLRTGNFYNKEREAALISKAGMDDDDFGFGDMDFGEDSFADFDGDEDFDSFDDFSDSVESDDGNSQATFVRKKGKNVDITQISVNNDLGVDSSIVKATEFQTETNIAIGETVVEHSKIQNRIIVQLLTDMRTELNTSIASIGDNVSQVTSILGESLSKHMSLSAKYYEDSIGLQTKILGHLENNMSSAPPDATQSNTKKFKEYNNVLDLFSGSGGFDIKGYKALVKKQFSNYVTNNMILSQLSFMDQNREGLEMTATTPLRVISESIAKTLIPTITKNAIKAFDDQLKETGVAALNQLSGLKRSNNPLLNFIGNVFGLQNKIGISKVNKSEYNKGAMSWSGVDHQAVTNVIPTLLRKILASVSGTEEIAFDYENGVFKKVSEIESDLEEEKIRRETSAFTEVKSDFKDKLDNVAAISKTDKNKITDDFQKVIQKLVRDSEGGRTFRKGGRNGKTNEDFIAEALGKSSEDTSVKTIRAYFETLEKTNKALLTSIFGSLIQEQRAVIDKSNRDIQMDPIRYGEIYRETGLEKAFKTDSHLEKNDKNNPLKVTGIKSGIAAGITDKYGHNQTWYLREILNLMAIGIKVFPVTRTSSTPDISGNDDVSEIISKSNKIISKYEKEKKKHADDIDRYRIKDNYTEEKRRKDLSNNKIDLNESSQEDISSVMTTKTKTGHANDNEDNGLLTKMIQVLPEDTGLSAILTRIQKASNKVGGKGAEFFNFLETELFHLVFGGGKDRTKGFKGLYTRGLTILKTSLATFAKFFDDKIFKPLNDALFGENGLISKIKETQFGKGISEFFKKAIDKFGTFLLGSKDADGKRSGGIFSETANALKGIGTNIKEGIFGKKGADGKPLPLDQDDSIFGNLKRMTHKFTDKIDTALGVDSSGKQRTLTDQVLDMVDSMFNRIKNRGRQWSNNIFGTKDIDGKRINGLFDSEFSKQFKSDLKGQKGYIGATAGIGLLSSFFLPGGPIGGALLGAGYGIVKKSTGIQDFLFGPEVDGERQGGLIIKETQDFFKKHKFGMGFGATAGLLSSFGLLPSFFLPGGPIGGALIGTGVSLIAKSGAFNDILYGPGGTSDDPIGGISKKFKEAFGKDKSTKDIALDAGIGAGLGIFGSFFLPGGPIIGALIGSAISIGTATEKFQNWFFGPDDGSGNREGGVFTKFKNKLGDFFMGEVGSDGKRRGGLLDQFTTSIKIAQTRVGEFIETQMVLPFKSAMEPFTEEAKKSVKRIKDNIKGGIDSIKQKFTDSVISPVADAFKTHLINPMKGLFKRLFGGLGKIVGAIISAPFKMVGGLGNATYEKHKREGKRDYINKINKEYNPFKRSNWDVEDTSDKGFFGKLFANFRGFGGAVGDWSKHRTDRDALYNAQFSDAGAYYDRDNDVKKPERDKKALDDAHKKWEDRRNKYRGNGSGGSSGSGSSSDNDSDDKTGVDTTPSGRAKRGKKFKSAERHTGPKKGKPEDTPDLTGVDTEPSPDKDEPEKPESPKSEKPKGGTGFNKRGGKWGFGRKKKPKGEGESDEPEKPEDSEPGEPTGVDTEPSGRRIVRGTGGGKFGKLKFDDIRRVPNEPSDEKEPTGVDTTPSNKPSPDKDTSDKEDKKKSKKTLLNLVELIQKDTDKMTDSVYGQLNGVGSNVNKIYKLLLKQFNTSDDDIDGENNKEYVGFLGRLRTKLNRPFKAIKDLIMAPFRKVGKFIGGVIDKGKEVISGVVSGVKTVGKELVSGIKTVASGLFDVGLSVLKLPVTLVDTGLSLIKSAAPAIGEGLKTAVSIVGDGLTAASTIVVSGVQTIGNVVSECASGLGTLLGGAMAGLGSLLSGLGIVSKELIVGAFKGMGFIAKGAFGAIKFGANLVKSIVSAPFKLVGGALGKFGDGNSIAKHVIVDKGSIDVNFVKEVGVVKSIGAVDTTPAKLSNEALQITGPQQPQLLLTGPVLEIPPDDNEHDEEQQSSGGEERESIREILRKQKESLKSILSEKKETIRDKLKRKDESERKTQTERGSRESLLKKFSRSRKDKEEGSFRDKLLALTKRGTEAAEAHRKSFFDVFDLKKGVITAGLLMLAPFIIKLFTKFDIGGLLTRIVGNLGTGYSEVGGLSGIVSNAGEVIDSTSSLVTGKRTQYALENGHIVYDENGNPVKEKKRVFTNSEFFSPTKTRIDTETGEFEHVNDWTMNSDSKANFVISRLRKNKKRLGDLYGKAKDIATGKNTKVRNLAISAAATMDNISDKVDSIKNSKVGTKVKSGANKVKNSKAITKAVEYMKKAFNFLVEKFSGLGKKYGKKITESSLKLNKFKNLINVEKLSKNKTIVSKIEKFLAKWTAKASTAAFTLMMSEVGFAAFGALSGATNAGALFEVDPDAVDGKMRAIAAVFKGLLNTSLGSWVDLINSLVYELLGTNFLKIVATQVYAIISDEEDTDLLEESQKQFTEDYEAYVDEEYNAYVEKEASEGREAMSKEDFISNGLATTREEYNSKKNKSLTSRAANLVKKVGKVPKKIVSGVKSLGSKAIDNVGGFLSKLKTHSSNLADLALSGDITGLAKYSAFNDEGHADFGQNAVISVEKQVLLPIALIKGVIKGIPKLFSSGVNGILSLADNTKKFIKRLWSYTNPDNKITGWSNEFLGKNNEDDEVGLFSAVISSVLKTVLAIPVGFVRVLRSAFKWVTDLFGDDDNTSPEDIEKASEDKGFFSKLKSKVGSWFSGNGGSDGGYPIYGKGGTDDYYYSQNDPKYKNKVYKQTGETMGDSGCGPTAMAMVASRLKDNKYDPMTMAKMAEAGGYSNPLGTSPEYFGDAATTLGIPSTYDQPSYDSMAQSLSSGNTIILQGVKSSGVNSPFTSEGHYVVINGMGNGNVEVSDPRGREYSGQYNASDVLADATGMWSFGGGKGRSKSVGILKNLRRGGKGDTDKWISVVKSVKAAIAAKKPGYSQTNYITITIDGKSLKVRTDCSGFVSACLKYFGVLNDNVNLTSTLLIDKSNTSMKATGFTPMSWSGWDSLQEGDIIAKQGHTEIFAYNKGDKHYVYNCGSDSSVNTPEATRNAYPSYNTVWRCGSAGANAVSGASISSSDDSNSVSTSEDSSISSLSDIFTQMGSIMKDSVMESLGFKTSSSSGNDDSSVGTSGGPINLSGDSNTSKIWNYLTKDEGLTPIAAAGAMGCWQQESSNDPTRVEGDYLKKYPGFDTVMASSESLDDYTQNILFPAYKSKINKDAYLGNDGHYYPGIGLAQWTGPRAYNLKKFGEQNGGDWRNLETQLDFFSNANGEFNSSSRSGLKKKLNDAKTTDLSTSLFAKHFEGYKGDYSTRKQSARQIYEAYAGGKGGTPISPVYEERDIKPAYLNGGKGNISSSSESLQKSTDVSKIIDDSLNSGSMTSAETSQLLNTVINYLSKIVDNTGDTSNGIRDLNNKEFTVNNNNNVSSTTNNGVYNNGASTNKSKTDKSADRSKYNMAKRVAAGILY